MAMDAKQRKTLFIRLGAGLFLVFVLLFLGWYLFWPSEDTKPKQSPLGASDTMIPAEPQKQDLAGGQMTVNPTAIQFAADTPQTQGKPETIIAIISAVGAPVTIQSAVVPPTDADAISVSSLDCPAAPQQLPAGSSCTFSVTWNKAHSVSTALTISGTTTNTGGVQAPLVQNVAITGVTTTPTAPAGGAAGAAGGAGAEGQAPPPSGAPDNTQAASGPSPAQQARDEYLQGRRGMGINVVQAGQLQPTARSPYASWDNIGVQGDKSSFPVDMSRVITPDKPLTAVLTYQIDTRATVTAVAMVDRDVYGNNGRTVVIPRGTKIIGKVGGGATDRVGIAWNQLIRPDGVRFVFSGESGDAMGRGGVPGRINNRYLERYGFSLLPSLAGAGITAMLGGQTNSAVSAGGGGTSSAQTQDAKAVAAQILQQPLTQIAQDIYSKKSQIPVQITIPAGTRLTVWSTGDLRLKPVGESDDPATQQGGQNGNQQGQGGAFGPVAQRQNGGNQGSAQRQTQAPASTARAPSRSSNDDEGGSSLQVGRVDANGNYIAPGASAPAPGPIVVNNSNGSRTTVTSTPNTAANGQTNFPAASNPWK